jgi:hypothetical protein
VKDEANEKKLEENVVARIDETTEYLSLARALFRRKSENDCHRPVSLLIGMSRSPHAQTGTLIGSTFVKT